MKILVALSGGVDSAVAAHLLNEQGHDVTGVFVINYDDGTKCWNKDYQDAVRVAAKIGIPIITFDFQKEYKKHVLDYMYTEYAKGRTPNPDILCNQFIKFGVWLKKANALGYDKLATGHYARCIQSGDTFKLLKAADENKDQTYFLSMLDQNQLSHSHFPLGDLTKEQVRVIARKNELPVADKEESMGICFVGEVPMKQFLKQKIESKKGNIVDTQGTILGRHDGLPFYTIGQRHIGTASEHALYVLEKRSKTNEIVVGNTDDPLLYKDQVKTSQIHHISGQTPQFPLECEVRLRHRQPLQKCTLYQNRIDFSEPQRAVTPGQFAVFYKDKECLGSAEIH